MGRLLTILFCALLVLLPPLSGGRSSPPAFGQGLKPPPAPGKIDEWGAISCDDLLSRMDNFAAALRDDESSRAFIVSYGGRRTLPGRLISYAEIVKPYLTAVRGIEPGRIFSVAGGERERMSIEVWVVPAGATPPVPDPPYTEEVWRPAARFKFDEGFADYVVYDGKPQLWTRDMDCITDGIDPRGFGRALKARPGSRGHVIVYNECGKSRRRAAVVGRLVRREIATEQGAGRITAVHGGCRDVASVELWVVPPGVSVPAPSPGKWIRDVE